MCTRAQLHLTLCDPMDCSPPGSSIHGFSRQEYWSGVPFSPPGDLPDPGIKPESPACPALTGGLFTTEPPYTENLQFSSVAQSCLTLWDPMNCSTPGLPVHNQLLEFTQTRVHRVRDAIQPSHPLSSPSPPAPNPSQHQRFFPVSQLFT